jgi:hypothetical protein
MTDILPGIKVILRDLAPGVDLDVVTATAFWLEWA